MATAPIAVLPVAAAAAATAWAGELFALPPLVVATLIVAVLGLATGGLHLDGLADTVDGMATHGTRARRLEVMRRGDVGPSGATALLLVLSAEVGALAALVAQGDSSVTAVVLAVVVSRAALAPACMRGLPAARADGLGHTVVGAVPPLAAVLVVVATTALVTLVAGLGGLVGVVVAAATVAAVLLLCGRKLGGSTGDVLGACVEIAFAAFLVTQVSSLTTL
jgi:adenosylcobinamide-GDP ribazoletransferase